MDLSKTDLNKIFEEIVRKSVLLSSNDTTVILTDEIATFKEIDDILFKVRIRIERISPFEIDQWKKILEDKKTPTNLPKSKFREDEDENR